MSCVCRRGTLRLEISLAELALLPPSLPLFIGDVPPQSQAAKVARDGHLYHITIMEPSELKQLKQRQKAHLPRAFKANSDELRLSLPPLPMLLRQASEDERSGKITSQEKGKIKDLLLSGQTDKIARARRFMNGAEEEQKEQSGLDTTDIDSDFYVLGLGFQSNCYFLVVHFPSGDAFRQKHKLPPKDYHITLGFLGKDVYGVPKGISTLVREEQGIVEALLQHKSKDIRKAILMLEALSERQGPHPDLLFALAKEYCKVGLMAQALNLANHLGTLGGGKAMLFSEVLKLTVNDFLKCLSEQDVNSAFACLNGCVVGLLPSDDLKATEKALTVLNSRMSHKMVYYDPTKGCLVSTKLPMNFTMVDEFVGGSGIVSDNNIKSLVQQGFKTVITLTEDPLPSELQAANPSLRFHHFPIIDRTWNRPVE